MEKGYSNDYIEQSFLNTLKSLSKKEEIVIKNRVGFEGERKTLQGIGESFSPNITRERVRQIELAGIKKLEKIIKNSPLVIIQDKAFELLEFNGGVLVKDLLINELIKQLNISSNINTFILDIIVQSKDGIFKSKPKIGVKPYFYLENINKNLVDSIHKEALKILKKRKNIMNQIALYEQIKINLGLKSISLINSVLEIFDDIVKGEKNLIALEKWKILNPKTLKDKAIYVLKKDKVPMHFIDISNKITEYLGDVVKLNTIHNELIRNDEFVLIGRGIYALKEWGFKEGTVLDVIIDVLSKKKEPMSTEDIVNSVLKVRNVKRTTIYMNLQNKKFIERVGRNFYTLKENIEDN